MNEKRKDAIRRPLDEFVVRVFSFIWRKWLVNEWQTGANNGKTVMNKVEIVTGWRSAYVGIYSRHGYRTGREHQTFCPKIWRWYLP